ncbi:MAG: DUF4982 domain-containing protein [Roseburia sp.]|nr:DUF4982 domain-containing protein [Roseburia sp.]MCM1241843.1 DUF4982 domain-containing protein [Roseburia sp.]
MNKKILWDDDWSFLKTDLDTSYKEAAARYAEFEPVEIPHDWQIYDTQNLYADGIGWYRKLFRYDEDGEKKVFITFEGVYMDSTIYLNGEKAGEWKYGYSTFTLDVTEYVKKGENEILVSVRFQNPNSRWYSGAGIYRDVWFHVTEKTYLPENAVYISTNRQTAGKKAGTDAEDFVLHLETEIAGTRCEEASVRFRLFDHEGVDVNLEPMGADSRHASTVSEAADKTDVSGAHSKKVTQEFLVQNVRLWDVESPTLYLLMAELVLDGKVLQKAEVRFGFRFTEFNPDKGFFLNGRHLKLNGVCEHHDLGALGAAFNKAAMRRKFRILKEMGVNAVRSTHNMAAPGFIELADEMGLLVISEAFDMWELPKTTYDYARFFVEWSARDVESWVKRDRNHPSVIMWSVGNEIYDTHVDAHGQEITRYLKEEVEKHDDRKNAVVTIGSNFIPWENAQKCSDILKVAGYNYAERYYEEHHKKYPDWIIYGSETSSIVQSRGVYHFPLKAGILTEDDRQCSSLGNSPTSWGAKSLEYCITVDRDTSFSMGQFLWTGFDYIGEPTPYQTKNSYFGQVDTAGFPKDSYYIWQSVWTDHKKKPMIHILPYWDFNEGQLIDVRVCSNAPYVELFMNGKSLGRQHLAHEAGSGAHILADYNLPYEKGVLMAAAYDENGLEVAREEKHSFGNSQRIVLTAESTKVRADGRDLLFITIETRDDKGILVENACDRVEVRVTGAGRLVGLDNGDSTDYDSYKGTSRRLFNGKLLAIIEADTTPGEIYIEVTGKGVQEARLVCEAVNCVTDEGAQKEKSCNVSIEENRTDRFLTTQGLSTLAENRDVPVITGRKEEIPVRKIVLYALEGQTFSKEQDAITVEARIEPAEADDQEIFFRAANDTGVPVMFVDMEQKGHQVRLRAKGDGEFRLCAMSKSGTDQVRIMSQLEFKAEGLGAAYKNPYAFISAALYDEAKGEIGNGNDHGIATEGDEKGETVVTYHNLDFGNAGSDEFTIWGYALNDDEYPIQVWLGIPGEEGSELLADVIYQKPYVWNLYQDETYKLKRVLKGIVTLSFCFRQKILIKGFTFTAYEKAWMTLSAGSADKIYGDSFAKTEQAVEGIGNNVSLIFTEMDFGEKKVGGISIKGRAKAGNNAIHIRFFNGTEEIKQMVEFPAGEDYAVQDFILEPVAGKWEVDFVFLPGSSFDFESFRFYPGENTE